MQQENNRVNYVKRNFPFHTLSLMFTWMSSDVCRISKKNVYIYIYIFWAKDLYKQRHLSDLGVDKIIIIKSIKA
jgi:hypothetical protein